MCLSGRLHRCVKADRPRGRGRTKFGSGYIPTLERLDDCTSRIPKASRPGMLVDGLFFADELRGMMPTGVSWLAARGLATPDDVACAEAEACTQRGAAHDS